MLKRYAKTNNQYLDDYDDTKEKSFLLYIDANALYADVMLNAPLPLNSFEFIGSDEMANISPQYILDMVHNDCTVGCFIEVDLEYPSNLHDTHKQYPLCAEKMIPPCGREEARGYRYSGSCVENELHEKLMLTLYDKKKISFTTPCLNLSFDMVWL